LSGVIALGFGWWGQQEALLHVADLAGPMRLAIVLAIQPIAIASIAGGLAILVYPAVARAAMLASAVGWLVLVAIIGGGLTLPAGLLIVLSAGGGLLGFLPSLKEPLFRIQRAGQQDARDTPPFMPMRSAPSPMPSRFEAVAARQQRAEPPRPAPQPPARLAQVRPGSYFPTFDTMEGPFSSQPLPTLGEEDHSQPFSLPEDEQGDAWRPYYPGTPGSADGQEDHSQPFVPVESSRDYDPSYVQSEPSFADSRGGDRRSYDFRSSGLSPLADKPRRKATKRGRGRATAGMAALVLIIIGTPALLVLDAQMRADGQVKPASVVTTTPGPTVKQKPASGEQEARLKPQAPLKLSPTPPPALEAAVGPQPSSAAANQFASLAPPTAADAAPVTTTASLPMPAGPPYASLADYCVALNTSDSPDVNKITGGLVPSVVAAIHKTTSKPQGDIRWRCMDRAVWVCVAPKGEVACDREPTAVDRSLFCAAHPNAYGVHTAGGDWNCDGFTPVLPKGKASVVDRRGYDKAAWVELSASAAAATG
jgi:hypothetical protein